MKNRNIIFAFLALFSYLAIAQQDAQFTQYMYNTVTINPAFAGSRGLFNGTIFHRSQWVGLEGAPVTQSVSFNTPLGESNRVGLGISALNDEIGPSTEQVFFIDFSYNIDISDNTKLAFGLKAGGNLLTVDFSKLGIRDPQDPGFGANIDNRFAPNFGVGVYIYGDNGYVGLSAPTILETEHFDTDENPSSNSLAVERATIYFMGGYVFELSDSFKFKPAILTKYTAEAPIQVDLSTNFLYNEKLTFGLGYRPGGTASGLAGFQVSKGILIGYAYDFQLNGLQDATSGSHEVFLRFEVFKKEKAAVSPVFF
ncbi:PorP/SprF family type IX secretion system membrane protein [Spongiivirga citrea]|uniref:Type IX secretion system membrane protein PorP/SprF n=1 Tax=Spongiivirga citrea TaxID=1481457 RepID=A0A6M0CK44_9FLAO|nr:type IX secretion system membrane protein PorP/SprF [Spongiivirga citrea]NER16364.1 type IX secretion system membrane protein PorP/SprF [Spongiivirga citrea]